MFKWVLRWFQSEQVEEQQVYGDVVSTFVTNDDVQIRTGTNGKMTFGVSWEGIQSSPDFHKQLDQIQVFREKRLL